MLYAVGFNKKSASHLWVTDSTGQVVFSLIGYRANVVMYAVEKIAGLSGGQFIEDHTDEILQVLQEQGYDIDKPSSLPYIPMDMIREARAS